MLIGGCVGAAVGKAAKEITVARVNKVLFLIGLADHDPDGKTIAINYFTQIPALPHCPSPLCSSPFPPAPRSPIWKQRQLHVLCALVITMASACQRTPADCEVGETGARVD